MKSQLLQDICESADAQVLKARRLEPEAAEPSPFASERADWVGAQVEDEADWLDRWGRRAAAWATGLVALALLAGAGLWLYRERGIDNALVMVAKNSVPAPQASPVAPPPPVKLAAAAPDPVPERAVAPAETKPEPLPLRTAPPRTKAAGAKPRLTAALPSPDVEGASGGQLAETLKQCRAMGYHATQCLKRGCVMTRYGLACHG